MSFEEGKVADGSDDRELAELVVGVLSKGRITIRVGRVVECIEAQRQAGRLDAAEASELVEFVAQLLPSTRRESEVGEAGTPEATVTQAQLSRPDEQQVRKRDAMNLYHCTIQVANQQALVRVLEDEGGIWHNCPEAERYSMFLTKSMVTAKGRRCVCDNKDCWVYQYTQPDNTPTEHKGA